MTQEDYTAGVDWVALKSPKHALLRALQQGYTPANVLYLKHVLTEIGQPTENSNTTVEVDDLDPQLLIWYKQRRTLFTHRAKLSNRFHDCKTDTERAAVSDDIKSVQLKIKTCLRNIRIYKQTGQIPEPAPEEPELTGVPLMKKYRSVVANISTKRRNIRNSAHARDEATKAKRAKWEQKLKELEREKLQLERLIARESV